MKRVLTLLACTACIAALLLFYNTYVPPNMDEFSQYHTISCHYYPNNTLNIFREPCNGYFDIAVIGKMFWPLRAYLYIGVLPSLFYFPFFLIWPSFESARLFGLLFLVLQAFLIKKILKINAVILLVVLCLFFPYSYQHAADTGPIVYHTTSVYLLIYLLSRWTDAVAVRSRAGWLIMFGLGVLIFANIWTKLSFFFLLPASAMTVFYYVMKTRPTWSSPAARNAIAGQLLLMIGTAGSLTWALLNGMQRWGSKYLTMLNFYPRFDPWKVSEIKDNFLERVWPYFLDPLKTAHRVFSSMEGVHYSPLWIGAVIVFCMLMIAGLIYCLRAKKDFSFPVLMMLCFGGTLYVMSMSQGTWAMHHVVLAFPFLILCALALVRSYPSRNVKIVLFLFFAAVNLVEFNRLTGLQPGESSHASLLTLNRQLNESFSDEHAFVVLNWGFYYTKALYGNKNQAVLYIEPLNEQDKINSLKEILTRHNRKPVFIGRKDNEDAWSLIGKAYPDLKDMNTSYDTGPWVVRFAAR